MKKEDWLEVVKVATEKDWTDWLIITITIISAIVGMVSVIFAAISAKAAKSAADISLEMYKEEKASREKSVLPVFDPSGWIDWENDVCIISIKNSNVVPISGISIEIIEPDKAEFSWSYLDDNITPGVGVKGDYKNVKKITLKISYDALNHSRYNTVFDFKVKDDNIVLENKETKKIS